MFSNININGILKGLREPMWKPNLTDKQSQAIKCSYADLVGALQAKDQNDIHIHDWEAHKQSIEDLESNFGFIEKQKTGVESHEGKQD